jgi:hypothetical protein
MQLATQQGENSTTSPKRLLWAVNGDSASQKHKQVRRDLLGSQWRLRQSQASTSPKRLHWTVNGDSASQQRQQVRRDFTGQSIETPPVRAGEARTAKRKGNMDKHRKITQHKNQGNARKDQKAQNKTKTRTKNQDQHPNRAQDQDQHQKQDADTNQDSAHATTISRSCVHKISPGLQHKGEIRKTIIERKDTSHLRGRHQRRRTRRRYNNPLPVEPLSRKNNNNQKR